MFTSPLTDRFECAGVICEPQRLLEVDSGRIMVAVKRENIQKIRLRHGLVSPRPVGQVVIGSALITAAYFPAAHLIHWFLHGGVFFELETIIIPVAVVGLWLVITAFRRGYFLEVDISNGQKRLTFRRKADLFAVNQFADAIEHRFDLRIERETPAHEQLKQRKTP